MENTKELEQETVIDQILTELINSEFLGFNESVNQQTLNQFIMETFFLQSNIYDNVLKKLNYNKSYNLGGICRITISKQIETITDSCFKELKTSTDSTHILKDGIKNILKKIITDKSFYN